MRKNIIVLAAVLLVISIFAGCSEKGIEIENLDGEIIVIDTETLSDEQIKLLEDLSENKISSQDVMTSGEFTQEELADLGLAPNGAERGEMSGDRGGNMMINDLPLGDIDISTLNFDSVSDEAENAITEAIENNNTLQELLDSGVVTMEDLMAMGLFPEGEMGDMPPGNDQQSGRGSGGGN